MSPLEFLMQVVNDPDPKISELRVQAAIAILPYLHKAVTPLCTHVEEEDEFEDDE